MAHLDVIREIRRKLVIDGPRGSALPAIFATVTLPGTRLATRSAIC